MKFAISISMCPHEHYLPLARAADDAGFWAVGVPDSVFFPETASADYPYSDDGQRFFPPETPFLEPWVAIPAMAAVTERLRFFTMVLKLPIRQPLLVAKTVGSAAVLSGNRVALGVGVSWIPEEFEWLGSDYATRGARTDECIAVIRNALTGAMVGFDGDFHSHGPMMQSPAPSQPVPIYIGGVSPPALRRAGRVGDGWISPGEPSDVLLGYVARIRDELAANGRADAPFEYIGIPTDAFTVDQYAALADGGVTAVITAPWFLYPGDPDDLDHRIASVARFGREVIDAMAD